MKKVLPFLVAGVSLFIAACNNGTGDKKAADTAAAAPAKPAFTPFNVSTVIISVKDYAKWYVAYEAGDSDRKSYGVSTYVIGRNADDSNKVMIIAKIADTAKARAFRTSPGLKEAMQKAGVIGAPVMNMANVIRNEDTPIDSKDRVRVSHKVKDFAVWVKAFDADHTNRMNAGLLDRGLARDLSDSNMVHIVFAITDMAKAKAMMASPDLKKTMTDAGVTGTPDFFFYKITEKK